MSFAISPTAMSGFRKNAACLDCHANELYPRRRGRDALHDLLTGNLWQFVSGKSYLHSWHSRCFS